MRKICHLDHAASLLSCRKSPLDGAQHAPSCSGVTVKTGTNAGQFLQLNTLLCSKRGGSGDSVGNKTWSRHTPYRMRHALRHYSPSDSRINRHAGIRRAASLKTDHPGSGSCVILIPLVLDIFRGIDHLVVVDYLEVNMGSGRTTG